MYCIVHTGIIRQSAQPGSPHLPLPPYILYVRSSKVLLHICILRALCLQQPVLCFPFVHLASPKMQKVQEVVKGGCDLHSCFSARILKHEPNNR